MVMNSCLKIFTSMGMNADGVIEQGTCTRLTSPLTRANANRPSHRDFERYGPTMSLYECEETFPGYATVDGLLVMDGRQKEIERDGCRDTMKGIALGRNGLRHKEFGRLYRPTTCSEHEERRHTL